MFRLALNGSVRRYLVQPCHTFGTAIYSISPTLVWHEGGYSNKRKKVLGIKRLSKTFRPNCGLCSNEGEMCECYGRIRFGNVADASDHEADIVANGTIPCNRFQFGDPFPNVKKYASVELHQNPMRLY